MKKLIELWRSGAPGLGVVCATILLSGTLVVIANGQTPPPVSLGKVDPSPGCGRDAICFETPHDGLARDESRSRFFYAVILKTTTNCGVTERERRDVQARFPHNKVFATQFECGGDDNAFTYENIDRDHGFIAVYAGRNKAEATRFLKKVVQTKKFPGANLRRTQAVLVGS